MTAYLVKVAPFCQYYCKSETGFLLVAQRRLQVKVFIVVIAFDIFKQLETLLKLWSSGYVNHYNLPV